MAREIKAVRDAKKMLAKMGLAGSWRCGSKHYSFWSDGKLVITISQGAKGYLDPNTLRQDIERFQRTHAARP